MFCCAAYNQRGNCGGVSGSIGGGGGSGHGGGTGEIWTVNGGVKRQRGTGSALAVGRQKQLKAAAEGSSCRQQLKAACQSAPSRAAMSCMRDRTRQREMRCLFEFETLMKM